MVSTVLSIIVIGTSPRWAVIGLFIIGPVLAVMWVVSGYYLLKHWLTRPDMMTLMGTAVWTNGLAIKINDITDAINYYAANVAHHHPKLDVSTVLGMFGRARIEFTAGPIWFGEVTSLQHGYSMRVRWKIPVNHYQGGERGWVSTEEEGFGHNDFFHSCHHMVDEMLMGFSDAPECLQWWGMVPKLKQGWIDGPKKVSA